MITKTVTVSEGERLGPVPLGYDFKPFTEKWLSSSWCGVKETAWDYYSIRAKEFEKLNREFQKNPKGLWVWNGEFAHELFDVCLYDGWVFWVSRPYLFVSGPLGSEGMEWYNLSKWERR